MSASLLVKSLSLLVIVASPAAYFATKSHGGPIALSPKATASEFRTEAATLQLAPGWTWPSAPVRERASDGRGIVYEPGFGKQAADYYWYCSWSDRALDRAVSAAERRLAVENVLSIRQTFYFTVLAPISKPAFEQLLDDAARGDLRGLQRDYELNCPASGNGARSG